MEFHIEANFSIFDPFFKKRPEVTTDSLKRDLQNYYLPYIQKLFRLKESQPSKNGVLVGISAIQGTGKTTQGEILEILLSHFGKKSVSLSIDDFYLTHEELNKLRQKDPRYIRRGVTHDINLAVEILKNLKTLESGMIVKVPIYDKGAFEGDGDRSGWKEISEKPDFIFFDGWMIGVRQAKDDSVFESGLPALDTPEHIQFAKDINKKLEEYYPLWSLIDFMNILYVPNYEMSLLWRNQAEDRLRSEGKGMTPDQIREFVYYFWRSVHPAIQIKALAFDEKNTHQVVIINDDHSIKEILTPKEVKSRYN